MTDQKKSESNGVPQVREGKALEDGEIMELFSKDSLFVTHFYVTSMGPNVRLSAIEKCPDRDNIMKCKCAMVMTVGSLLALGDLIGHVKTQMLEKQKPTMINTIEEEGQKWG